MRTIFYRFHLSESQTIESSKLEEAIKKFSANFKNQKIRIIRTAINYFDENKNFSILCESEEEDTVYLALLLSEALLKEQINIKNEHDSELISEEECCGHEHSHHHEHHDHSHDHGHHHDHSHSHDNHRVKAALGLITGLALVILSLSGFPITLLASSVIAGLSSLITVYLGRNVYKEAWRAFREKRWDMSILYTISTLTIAVVSVLSIFVPGLPIMLEAAPLILGFWHLGEAIEHSLIDKINEQLDVRDNLNPQVLLIGEPDRELSIKELMPNDVFQINQGEVIPVDGVLLEDTLLYTTAINGSPYPKEFKAGDHVKAGMRLADVDHLPSLQLQATTTYQNSYLSLIAHHIKQANNEKAPVELLANKILKYFIPGLLLIAALSGVLIGVFFGPALAIQCVLSVLVSACPCALSLITPMAIKIGMKKAADEGVHFKNGKALQAAANIDTFVFDLNGTLTTGNIKVKNVHTSNFNKKYLKHFALLESHSKHPIGKIIFEHLQKSNRRTRNAHELTINEVDQSHHSGIKALIDGVEFIVGNREMLYANGITTIDAPYNNPQNGSTYMVRAKKIIGQIQLDDPLRDDAIHTIQDLKNLGKTIHLCTGADQATAEYYANILGISKENICANAVGTVTRDNEVSKSSYIQKLRKEGHRVAMVGDAANDLEAIADSDLGVAIKSEIGGSITEQHAGIVLQKGNLYPLVSGIDVGKKTHDNILQNLAISLTFNSTVTIIAAGLLVVAVGFTLNPALGVALAALESAIVLSNLLRLKQQKILSAQNNQLKEKNKGDTTTQILNDLDLAPSSPEPIYAMECNSAASHSFSGLHTSPKAAPTLRKNNSVSRAFARPAPSTQPVYALECNQPHSYFAAPKPKVHQHVHQEGKKACRCPH